MNIHHTAIWVNNLELMRQFYLKYFSCSCNAKYENPDTGLSTYFIHFSGEGSLELMHKPDVGDSQINVLLGYAHIAIDIGSSELVDQLTEQLEQDGYQVIGKPRTTGDGYYESVVSDPEGNRIELTIPKEPVISKANREDVEEILYMQKCCYLTEAEIINNYNIPPLMQTIEEINQDFDDQVILKLVFQNKIICLSGISNNILIIYRN